MARAERSKLALGTRVRYLWTVPRVDNGYLRWSLRITAHIRLGKKPPRQLLNDLSDLAGYCIDAPEVLPAGGCVSLHIPEAEGDIDPWIPAQLTFLREGP